MKCFVLVKTVSDLLWSPEPQVHSSVCTQNIAKIMGTNTSAFELLVLKRKIMGPCWLQIKKPQMDHKGVRPSVVIQVD